MVAPFINFAPWENVELLIKFQLVKQNKTKKYHLQVMSVGYCASIFMVQNARRWPDIAMQYPFKIIEKDTMVNIEIPLSDHQNTYVSPYPAFFILLLQSSSQY